jgi:spore germination protein GerM
VPDDNGVLVRKSVEVPGVLLTRENIARHRTELQEKLITGALKKLLTSSADSFPRGAALAGPVTLGSGVVNVNLNKAFAANSESWSSAETTARVMSIVKTAIATKEQVAGSESGGVRLLIEGKPVSTLGEFDTSEPIEPDGSAVPQP